jgi:prepilin-type N-terminal cleavage/methylation domain-containing protein
MKIRNGFTLLEILLGVAISAVAGALLLGIMVNNTGTFYQQTSKVTEGVGVNDAFMNIKTHIKSAQGVATQYPASTPATYTTGNSTLVLQLPAIDSSGNVIANNYDYVVYTTESDRLAYKQFPNASPASARKSANTILSKNVDSVLFEYLDSANQAVTPTAAIKVRTTLSLKQKAGANYVTKIATSEASLRND